MMYYEYIEGKNAREVIAVDVPDSESFYPYYEGLVQKKAKLMGVKLAGGGFRENDMLQSFLQDGGNVYKVRKGTKPLLYKPDGRKAKPILSWDTVEIAEQEAEIRIPDEVYEGFTHDEVLSDIDTDIEFWEDQWEFMKEALTELMGEGQYWKIEGYGMGWQKRNGYKLVKAHNGDELLDALLPKTECTFYLYKHPRGFKMVNYHHDAPTGENYIIVPISERTYNREA